MQCVSTDREKPSPPTDSSPTPNSGSSQARQSQPPGSASYGPTGTSSGVDTPLELAGVRLHHPAVDVDTPKLAIILDDIGYDEAALRRAVALNVPITYAVLPYLKDSEALARFVHQSGHEVMLHLPFEPLNYPAANPGEGAIMAGMTSSEVTGAVLDALREIPYARGVNNHMGSRATTDRAIMDTVMEVLRKHPPLYFIDSKTTALTQAYAASLEAGLPCAIRDVFIDNEPGTEHALKQLHQAAKSAEELGVAIAIGHPYAGTLTALELFLKSPEGGAVDLIHASEAIRLIEEEGL